MPATRCSKTPTTIPVACSNRSIRPLRARPNDAAWPGEGQYLFARGKLADANYITGPTYLLNWGITTSDKLDFHRMRAQAIAFTEMILRLGRTPRSKLITYTL